MVSEPLLPVSAKRNQGIAELIDQLHQWGEAPRGADGPLQDLPQLESPALDGWQQELVARFVTLPEGLLNHRTRLVDRLLLHPLHKLWTHNSLWKPGEVLDVGSSSKLTASKGSVQE